MANSVVLVTRPVEQQGALLNALNQRGYRALSWPLIKIVPIDIDAPESRTVKNQLLDLDLYSKVIVISRNAARIGCELIDQFWPQMPIGIDWFAIGAATAEELASWGVESRVNPGLDSESLVDLDQLQHLAEQRILILKGKGGRSVIEETLSQRGAQIDLAELYQRETAPADPVEATRWLEQGLEVAMVTSAEALGALGKTLEPVPELKEITLLVPSERVATEALRLGFKQVEITQGAQDSTMLEALDAHFKKDESR